MAAVAANTPCNECRVGGRQLAVLHPRSLVVYSVNSLISGQGVAAVQLTKIAEQALERSAANMVCGNFAGSTGACCVFFEFCTIMGQHQ